MERVYITDSVLGLLSKTSSFGLPIQRISITDYLERIPIERPYIKDLHWDSYINDPPLVFLYEEPPRKILNKGFLYTNFIQRILHWDPHIMDPRLV